MGLSYKVQGQACLSRIQGLQGKNVRSLLKLLTDMNDAPNEAIAL